MFMPQQPRPRRPEDQSKVMIQSNHVILMLQICTSLYNCRFECVCHGTRCCKMLFHLCKQEPFNILLVKNLSGIRLEDAKYIAKNIPISKVTSIHPTIPSNSTPHMLQQKRTTSAKDNSITIRKYLSIKRPKKSEIRTNKGQWTFLNEELHQNNKNIQLVEC